MNTRFSPDRVCGGFPVKSKWMSLARDLDRNGQIERFVPQARIEWSRERIASVRNRGDGETGFPFRVVHQPGAGEIQQFDPIPFAQATITVDADMVRCHLRTKIVRALDGHLGVQKDQIQDILLNNAFAIKAHRRDRRSFLEDVRVTALNEVGMVRQIGNPGDKPTLKKDGFEKNDVVEVGAPAGVRIVADKDVSRLQRREINRLHHEFGDAKQGTEVKWNLIGLGDDLATGIEDRGRAISAFLYVGGVRGANNCLAHFLDDRGKGASDNLDRNRIDR